MAKLNSPQAPEAPHMNGEAPRAAAPAKSVGARKKQTAVAPATASGPRPGAAYPIAPKAASIIQSLIADEAVKEAAYLAARNARMGAVEATASAMGIDVPVSLSQAKETGQLVFVVEGPGMPLPSGVEVVENIGD